MLKLKINNVRISLLHECSLEQAVCKKIGVSPAALQSVRILRKAVDARKKQEVCLNYHVLAEVDVNANSKLGKRLVNDRDVSKYEAPAKEPLELGNMLLSAPPVVIGAGPAGLLAALQLAEYGYKPILLERGKPVAQRVTDVARFWSTAEFDPTSNVQFGEGGAGTFSDGKLTTRVNDPVMAEILQLFVDAGAPENILWEHKPHVGTDKLRAMVTGLSKRICSLGGSIRYEARVTDLEIDAVTQSVRGVVLASGERIAAGAVVLACGHSARDTYAMLAERGVGIVAKPFAIGVRIEHPQELIDKAQYGTFAGHPLLGAADYALVYHTPDKTRTAYSFCMCPGGQVVAAASEAGGVVVNGMSMFKRDSGIANSALVVNVSAEDFGAGPLAGVEFQRRYERLAYSLGGANYHAPAQNLASFFARSMPSLETFVEGSYRPGLTACELDRVLPHYVTDTLRLGIESFGRKLAGYADGGALLTGVETRTSAPVRIERDRLSYESVTHGGLYPCGEGAGYAGGIMSAALDGYHVARAIMKKYAPVK
ncbi:MAG: FAD-binding protein [Phascolarctobacterium sp.]|nr:FAD-binding protein [Phascolarctobacterium sp.]